MYGEMYRLWSREKRASKQDYEKTETDKFMHLLASELDLVFLLQRRKEHLATSAAHLVNTANIEHSHTRLHMFKIIVNYPTPTQTPHIRSNARFKLLLLQQFLISGAGTP